MAPCNQLFALTSVPQAGKRKMKICEKGSKRWPWELGTSKPAFCSEETGRSWKKNQIGQGEEKYIPQRRVHLTLVEDGHASQAYWSSVEGSACCTLWGKPSSPVKCSRSDPQLRAAYLTEWTGRARVIEVYCSYNWYCRALVFWLDGTEFSVLLTFFESSKPNLICIN